MAIGSAVMPVIPSMRGMSGIIEKELDGAGKGGGKKLSAGIIGSLKGVAGPIAAAAGGAAVGGFLKDAIGGASDLNETVNKSSVIFGKNAGGIDAWAKGASTSVGLSREAALGATASLGDMFTQIGFAGDAAAKSSKATVQMAADLGSFSNLETGDVLDRIGGALRGEYDSLQAVIPNINAARVESEAMAASGVKNAKSLTAQQKAQAVLSIIQKDGAKASGDFAKTSDGLANRQKILAAQFADTKAQIGTQLLPVMTQIVGFVSTKVLPAVSGFATGMQNGTGAGGRFVSVLKTAGGALMSVAGFLVRNKDAIIPLVAGLGVAVGIFKTISVVTRAWSAAQGILNVVMSANPIGLVVLAVAGLVTGLVLAYKKSETFRNIVNGVFGSVRSGVVGAVTFAKSALTKLPGILLAPVRLAQAGLQAAGGAITSRLTGLKNGVLGVFRAGGWASGLAQVILHPIRSARTALSGVLDGVKSLFSNAVSSVGRIWDGIVSRIRGPIDTVTGMITRIPGVSSLLGKIPGFAAGTNSASRGLAMVGERGPELVDFGRGGQKVHNNRDTERMLADGRRGGNVTLNLINPQAEPTSRSIASAASLLALA